MPETSLFRMHWTPVSKITKSRLSCWGQKFSFLFRGICLLRLTRDQVREVEIGVFPTGVQDLRISGAPFHILRDNESTRRLYFLWDTYYRTWRIPFGLAKRKWSTPRVLFAPSKKASSSKIKGTYRIHEIRPKLAEISASLAKEPEFVTLLKRLLYSS